MTSFFDNLARAAGSGMSRRQALRRVGGLFAGAALGALGWGGRASADTLSNCNAYCKKYPAMKDFLACRSACLACSTAAQTCGSPSSGFTCVNFNSDRNNCGGCGKACNSTSVCSSGACLSCSAGQSVCGNTCVNTQNDSNNCGSCGNACGAGNTCSDGVCISTCSTELCGLSYGDCCPDFHCIPIGGGLGVCDSIVP